MAMHLQVKRISPRNVALSLDSIPIVGDESYCRGSLGQRGDFKEAPLQLKLYV